ncbi:MAG: hypothetical protein JXB47_21000 [Anaerolineae bacterium]|nr:hypothetical protein [Anaerolineae bacterium]
MEAKRPGVLGQEVIVWTLEGDWTETDKAIVQSVLDRHIPAKVDPTFNRWTARYNGRRFLAWRISWNGSCMSSEDASSLAAQIEAHYRQIQ